MFRSIGKKVIVFCIDILRVERETPAHITAKLEHLRKMPRKRPDWASMMKEIEVGKPLRKVQTNDRSRPILPQSKAKGKVLPGKTFTPLADELAADGDTNTKEVVIQHFLPIFSNSNHFSSLIRQSVAQSHLNAKLKRYLVLNDASLTVKKLQAFLVDVSVLKQNAQVIA